MAAIGEFIERAQEIAHAQAREVLVRVEAAGEAGLLAPEDAGVMAFLIRGGYVTAEADLDAAVTVAGQVYRAPFRYFATAGALERFDAQAGGITAPVLIDADAEPTPEMQAKRDQLAARKP